MLPIPPSVIFGIGRAIFGAASELVAEYKARQQFIEEHGEYIGTMLVLSEAVELITKERREYLFDGWFDAAAQGDEEKLAQFMREIRHEVYTLYKALIAELERQEAQDEPIFKSLKEQVEFFEKEPGQHLDPSSGADQ